MVNQIRFFKISFFVCVERNLLIWGFDSQNIQIKSLKIDVANETYRQTILRY